MKVPELMALPPLVTNAILPVVAPVGTVAVICVSEFTVNVADVPLNVTLVAWVRPVPVIMTDVPTGPLGGEKVLIVGFTLNVALLVSVVAPVATVTVPVSAPAGTVAKMKVLPVSCAFVTGVPPNLTTDDLLKPCPRMPICVLSAPVAGSSDTKGA